MGFRSVPARAGVDSGARSGRSFRWDADVVITPVLVAMICWEEAGIQYLAITIRPDSAFVTLARFWMILPSAPTS